MAEQSLNIATLDTRVFSGDQIEATAKSTAKEDNSTPPSQQFILDAVVTAHTKPDKVVRRTVDGMGGNVG
jgi:hypothetical protein|eukprot:COSAG01_NODE_685_length_14250_cov_18.752032_11_plen_70_part_00